MEEIPVSRMTPDEADDTARLIKETIWNLRYYNRLAQRSELAKYTAIKLIKKIGDDKDSVLLARDGHEIIGFCISTKDAYTIWLDWFGVRKGARRKGVGRALLTALESTVCARESHKLWCDCRTSNSASIKALSKFGFGRIVTIKNHWYGQDFIIWHKFVKKQA
jgi:ribosomal protein S18 acetylase RimI-like enzyme